MERVDSIDILIFTLKYSKDLSYLLKIPSPDVEKLKAIVTRIVNPYSALDVLYNAICQIDDKHLALKCYIALLRLEPIVENYSKMFELCDKALEFAEMGLKKYKRRSSL